MLAIAQPAAGHAVGVWFRPMVALQLKASGIATLSELIDFCNRRGGSWWRAIRRIGPARARRIVSWLRPHKATIGRSVDSGVDEVDPFKADDSQIVEIGGNHQTVVPLERMSLRASLSGAERRQPRAGVRVHPCPQRPRGCPRVSLPVPRPAEMPAQLYQGS